VPFTVLVNPQITLLTREVEEGWEGCLSVPGMRGWCPRYTQLRYTGSDEEGNPIDRVADGFHARVVQHECDHLDGILYPQRMTDMSRFGFIEELFPAKRSPTTEMALRENLSQRVVRSLTASIAGAAFAWARSCPPSRSSAGSSASRAPSSARRSRASGPTAWS
jgi:hypothetical protein